MKIVNRLLGLLVALALSTAAALTLIEASLALLGRPGWLIDRADWALRLGRLGWDDPEVLTVSAILLVVGILLVVTQLKPRRPSALATPTDSPGRRVAFDRQGLELHLGRLAAADEDVWRAQARIGRFRARLKATIHPRSDRRAVRRRLRQRLQTATRELELRRPRRIRVKVRPSPRRTR